MKSSLPSLTIIGAGKAGKALGRCFVEHGVFQIKQMLNTCDSSAKLARDFIGQGEAIRSRQELQPADVYLLGVPDDKIKPLCQKLLGKIAPNAIVFHLSGPLLAEEMEILSTQQQNKLVSAHVACSFAGDYRDLKGVYCTLQGHKDACEMLSNQFQRCGLKVVTVAKEAKILYHGFLVIACNYLVGLFHGSQKGLEALGIGSQQAFELLGSLVQGACDNIKAQGPTQALTGPIERGDIGVVSEQYKAMLDYDLQMAEIYRMLGQYTLQVAKEKGSLEPTQTQMFETLFRSINHEPD